MRTEITANELHKISPIALHLARLRAHVDNHALKAFYTRHIQCIRSAQEENARTQAEIQALYNTQIAWGISTGNASQYLTYFTNRYQIAPETIEPFSDLMEWFVDADDLNTLLAEAPLNLPNVFGKERENEYDYAKLLLEEVLNKTTDATLSSAGKTVLARIEEIEITDEGTRKTLTQVASQTTQVIATANTKNQVKKLKAYTQLTKSVSHTNMAHAMFGLALGLLGLGAMSGAIVLSLLLLAHSGGASTAALPTLLSGLSHTLLELSEAVTILAGATTALMGTTGIISLGAGVHFFRQRNHCGPKALLKNGMTFFVKQIMPATPTVEAHAAMPQPLFG